MKQHIRNKARTREKSVRRTAQPDLKRHPEIQPRGVDIPREANVGTSADYDCCDWWSLKCGYRDCCLSRRLAASQLWHCKLGLARGQCCTPFLNMSAVCSTLYKRAEFQPHAWPTLICARLPRFQSTSCANVVCGSGYVH